MRREMVVPLRRGGSNGGRIVAAYEPRGAVCAAEVSALYLRHDFDCGVGGAFGLQNGARLEVRADGAARFHGNAVSLSRANGGFVVVFDYVVGLTTGEPLASRLSLAGGALFGTGLLAGIDLIAAPATGRPVLAPPQQPRDGGLTLAHGFIAFAGGEHDQVDASAAFDAPPSGIGQLGAVWLDMAPIRRQAGRQAAGEVLRFCAGRA